jgi:hypothetical protein
MPRTAIARSAGGRPVRPSSRSPASNAASSASPRARTISCILGDAGANDTRCKLCGAFLYSVVRDGAFVHVAMGSLVDDPTIRPSKHIFVGSKARWFTITDDLPQYEAHAGGAPTDGG